MNIQSTYNWAKETAEVFNKAGKKYMHPLDVVKARIKAAYHEGWHYSGKGNRAQRRRGCLVVPIH